MSTRPEQTERVTRPCPYLRSERINLRDMDGNDTTASLRSPLGEHNGRLDVTLGSAWATTSAHLLQPPTALERR